MSEHDQPLMLPDDEYNQALVANVHPADWINPEPTGRYNIVVLGAGTAGLITSVIAASLGAKVALIERNLMGGDCLNVGCVPSKGMIRASRAVHEAGSGKEFGIQFDCEPQIAFATAMERMRKLRAGISGHDSAERFKKLGVDVY